MFAGEQYDSSLGDYYLRARYYDTNTGRFTRRDTYEGRLSEPLTLHKYLYTHANPVNGIDPTGLMEFSLQGLSLAEKIGITLIAIATIGWAAKSIYDTQAHQPETLGGFNEGNRPRTVLDGLFAWKNTWSAPALGGFGAGPQTFVPAHTGFPLNIGDLVRYVFSIDEVAYDIAHGHAWRDHLLDWSDLGIETQQGLAEHIEGVINHSTESKSLPRGRTAHWDETSKTLVIEDPGDSDGGTAFRPREGKAYFDRL